MKFCPECGKSLTDGVACNCESKNSTPKTIKKTLSNFYNEWVASKDYESKTNDIYESKKNIVPDCVNPNENEIPIKQYHIANFRSRKKLARAEGRMQITNNRLLYRATGCSIFGKTTVQQEFAINEIAGITATKDFKFNKFDLIFGIILSVYLFLITILLSIIMSRVNIFFGLSMFIGGQVLFYIYKKRPFIRLVSSILSLSGVIGLWIINLSMYGIEADALALFLVNAIPYAFILFIIALILFSFKPFAYISVISKTGSNIIQVIGSDEVMYTPETETAICEIGAIINDIQKLGDLGVNKWRK